MNAIDTLLPGGPIHWGVMLAQGWKGELSRAGWPDSWHVAQAWARRAEELGFDGIWVFDHIQPYPARDDGPVLEAWTTLAALSQVTDRAVLGTLVSCAAYRLPMITVRMAENLQRLTGGRFCLGLGAGWDHSEFDALGISFGSAAERSNQLDAVLSAIGDIWPQPRRTATSPFTGASADAGQRPLLLVGGDGEKRTLPAAVTYADVINWQVGISEFARKSRVVAQLSEAVGRDPASLRRTHAPNFQLFESEREFRRWCQDEQRGMSASEVDAYIRSRGALYGTASAIEAALEEFIDAGCSGFMIFCNASPALDSLHQLASMPLVTGAVSGAGGEAVIASACPRPSAGKEPSNWS